MFVQTVLTMLAFAVALNELPSNASGDPADQSKADGKINVLTEEPMTIQVKISDDLRAEILRRIEKNGLKTVRLKISNIELPENHLELKSLRLFLGRPDATVKTSIKDDHYVQSLVLGLEKKQTTITNIAPVIVRLHESGKNVFQKETIAVTIVPVGSGDENQMMSSLRMPFSKVTIELPDET